MRLPTLRLNLCGKLHRQACLAPVADGGEVQRGILEDRAVGSSDLPAHLGEATLLVRASPPIVSQVNLFDLIRKHLDSLLKLPCALPVAMDDRDSEITDFQREFLLNGRQSLRRFEPSPGRGGPSPCSGR